MERYFYTLQTYQIRGISIPAMLLRMVRIPLSPEQVKSGQRLGALFRAVRATRDPKAVARSAGISPETLRKIEVGRLPSPSFGTVVGLCEALGLPLQNAVDVWRGTGEPSNQPARHRPFR